MTTMDETRALPDLSVDATGIASFSADSLDEAALAALAMRAMGRHAAAVSEAGQARLVSVSHDVTGTRFAGGKGEVTSKIDRQTRTLLFMGADLVSEAGLHLHSTGIFRLDTD